MARRKRSRKEQRESLARQLAKKPRRKKRETKAKKKARWRKALAILQTHQWIKVELRRYMRIKHTETRKDHFVFTMETTNLDKSPGELWKVTTFDGGSMEGPHTHSILPADL